jgi:hypothetical protein
MSGYIYRIFYTVAFLSILLSGLQSQQAFGAEPGYVHYFQFDRGAGLKFDVYVYEGTHEEVYGTVESCGPMEKVCSDEDNWVQWACWIFQDLYASGYEETAWTTSGLFSYENTTLSYLYPLNDPLITDSVWCNLATGEGKVAFQKALTPIDQNARWLLVEDVSDGGFQQVDSVQIEQDGQNYTVDFVYGKFNELFTSDETSCGLNLSELCTQGRAYVQKFSEAITDALHITTALDSAGKYDLVYLPFETAGDQIKVLYDADSAPNIDKCCTEATVSRDQNFWWARFSPRVGGTYGSPVCDTDGGFRSAEDNRGFDPLNGHYFPPGDSQFTQTYNQYPVQEDTPFPKPEHDCKDSDYQGTVGLKNDSGSDKREHYTYLASNPRLIDLANYDSPQEMLDVLGSLKSSYTRHLKVIHSLNDKRVGLPPVTFHYKLDYLDYLFNDKEGMDKYWYLRTTPPGSQNSTELPKRNGTDEFIEDVSSNPDYCMQSGLKDIHDCKMGAFGQSKDHSIVIEPGTSVLYMWQLAEADNARPDAEYSISDARDEWYAEGSNAFDPNGAPEWYLLTEIVGILFNYSVQNDDDLLAASKFEISHGAAYALAEDYKYNSLSKPLPVCRVAMRQVDESVQKISNSDSGCGSDKKTWILPVSKFDTRGTVFTNIWAEVVK